MRALSAKRLNVNPVFRRHKLEAQLERDRVEILEIVSKALTRKYVGFPSF